MGRIVLISNRRGFTLIEVLVAFVIITVSFLALAKITQMAMYTNTRNIIRDEGVKLAQDVINRLKAVPVSSLPTGTWTTTTLNNILGYDNVTKSMRNFNVNYTISVTVTPVSDVRIIDVTVRWPYRGSTYTHTVSAMVR